MHQFWLQRWKEPDTQDAIRLDAVVAGPLMLRRDFALE
jgi:hypothetical protein